MPGVDFRKAFDSISHDFTKKSLKAFNFPNKFIKVIKNMLRNSTVKINLNNHQSKNVKIGKGTKQGDPISPSIFDLVIEHLSTKLHESLIGITIEGTKYTNLLFADDLVLICADFEDLKKALKILKEFGCASGLFINPTKCAVTSTLSHPQPEILPPLKEIMYLGFRFDTHGLVNKVDKMDDMISSLEKWKISASQRNRSIILKTYALSKMWHQQYLSVLPKTTFNKLTNISNWFTWTNLERFDLVRKFQAKMSITRSCKEYWDGGLKIWDIEARYKSQKAWLFEKILRSTSYTNQWWFNALKHKQMCSITRNITFPLMKECIKHWLQYTKPFLNQIKSLHLTFEETWTYYTTHIATSLPDMKQIYSFFMNRDLSKSSLTEKQMLIQTTHHFQFQNLFKNLYKCDIPLKERATIFKIINNTLPMMKNGTCLFCSEKENTTHIFFGCKYLAPINGIISLTTFRLGIKDIYWSERSFWYLLSRRFKKTA